MKRTGEESDLKEEELGLAIRKGIWSVCLSLLLVIALLIGAWNISWTGKGMEEIWNKARWHWVFFGWAMMCSALWAMGHRWKALLPKNKDISGSELGSVLCGALLLNYAIPGPFGDLAAAWQVHKKHQVPLGWSLASGASARIIGLICAAFGAALIYLFFDIRIPEMYIWPMRVAVISSCAGGLALVLIMFRPEQCRSWLPSPNPDGFAGKIRNALDGGIEGIIQTREHGRFFQAFAWSFMGHLLAFSGLAISLWGLTANTEWMGFALTYTVGTCLGPVAFLFPGSQFAWDGMIAGLLDASTELDPVQSITGAMTLRIEQLAMMALGALSLFWFRSSLQKKHTYGSIPETEKNENDMNLEETGPR